MPQPVSQNRASAFWHGLGTQISERSAQPNCQMDTWTRCCALGDTPRAGHRGAKGNGFALVLLQEPSDAFAREYCVWSDWRDKQLSLSVSMLRRQVLALRRAAAPVSASEPGSTPRRSRTARH
jgi:hypothetical protein